MKYDVRFCDCGRVHFIPTNLIERVCADGNKPSGKEVIFVCRGCGETVSIWFDEYDDGLCYCANELKREDLIPDPEKQVPFISWGYQVPMNSGRYADSKRAHLLIDEEGLQRNRGDGNLMIFKEVGRTGTLSVLDEPATSVRMSQVLRELDGDKLRALSGFLIDSFDWSKTEFARK